MTSATLVLPESITEELIRASEETLETAGVLIVRFARQADSEVRILGRELHWVPDDGYIIRHRDRLSIASTGYVEALRRAESIEGTAMWVHTHPGASSRPSSHDRIVDDALSDVFRIRTGSEAYGALTVASKGPGLSFTGHVELDGARVPIQRLWCVGSRMMLHRSEDSRTVLPSLDAFDRNIKAFGRDIQLILSDLSVAIVGCGGTGSAVAEQLVRLGVRRVSLYDADRLSASNVTRVYGSFPSDVGRPKCDVLAAHLRRIADDARVHTVKSMISRESTARTLTEHDVIFGCTDDNAGRLVLSRLSSYYLTPVFDCGVLLTSEAGGGILGIDGRVTVMAPGNACLVCRGRIDLKRAAAELLTPDERVRREDEGYAPGLGGEEPAVVAFTSMVASLAVAELLERLIGFGPKPIPGEILLRGHDRELSTNVQEPSDGHYCDLAAGKVGVGDTEPFLEQTWVA